MPILRGLRHATAVAGVLLVAACTTVVPDVRTRTPIYEALIPAAPEPAANCIAGILDQVFAPVAHEVVSYPGRGAAEVVGSSTLGTAVVISLNRLDDRTRIAVRRSPLVTLTRDDSEYAKAIASCATAK